MFRIFVLLAGEGFKQLDGLVDIKFTTVKKAVQIIASLGIYFLLWKGCSYLPAFDKANPLSFRP